MSQQIFASDELLNVWSACKYISRNRFCLFFFTFEVDKTPKIHVTTRTGYLGGIVLGVLQSYILNVCSSNPAVINICLKFFRDISSAVSVSMFVQKISRNNQVYL